MSLLDYSTIPGYAEAVNAEQCNRDLAYLPGCPPICGVPVRQMTPRMWILLIGCGNSFFKGLRPRPEDVAVFLWFVSPDYSVEKGRREAFLKTMTKQLKPYNFGEICRAIYAYLERTFQDCPQNGGDRKQYTAPIASFVDLFASQYGWSAEQTLEMPLAIMFQQMRRIEMRLNPKAPQFNRSEQLVGAWLAKLNERN